MKEIKFIKEAKLMETESMEKWILQGGEINNEINNEYFREEENVSFIIDPGWDSEKKYEKTVSVIITFYTLE